jgi:hypothetical protein
MNPKNINLNNITINKENDNFYNIYYDSKKLEIETPIMCCPFGLEEEYSNLIFKLQFKNLENDVKMKDLYNFAINFEEKISNLIGESVKSQLRLSEKYPPMIISKVVKMKNNILTEITDEDNNLFNVYNLKNKYNYGLKCLIKLDKIWKYNNKYYYKWNLIKVKIYDLRLRK